MKRLTRVCPQEQKYIVHEKEKMDNTNRPTNAFGEIEFVGSSNDRAKFIKVLSPSNQDLDQLSKEIYTLLKDDWKLKLPKIIISVTGGAKNFKMRSRLTKEFRQSLIKAAVSTGAWIVSGGTHVGVMKHVGNAIFDHRTANSAKVIALGIATWGIVKDREKLGTVRGQCVEYECNHTTSLDRNHTHFILVDDRTINSFGREIEVRTHLESYIAEQNNGCQVVCVIVQGGPGSFETVYNALKKKTPVVVVGGSGGWANILATIYNEKPSDITPGYLADLLADQNIGMNEESKLSRFTAMARECVEHKKLITVFSFDNRDSVGELDVAILQAILTADVSDKLAVANRLELAFNWDRSDFAHSYILTDDVEVRKETIFDLFMESLKQNKPGFVKLFLDFGVQLRGQFTEEELVQRYKQIQKIDSAKDVSKLKKGLMGPFYKEDSLRLDNSKDVLRELFIWSIIKDQKECGKLLWRSMGAEGFPASLVAGKLLVAMAKNANFKEKKDELFCLAEEYKRHSYDILSTCYDTDAEKSIMLLKRRLDNWGGLTCLEVAVDTEDHEFVSHPAVQLFMNKVWLGEIVRNEESYDIIFWLFIFLAAFLPFLVPILFNFNPMSKKKMNGDLEMTSVNSHSSEESGFLNRNDNEKFEERKFLAKIICFYSAPIVKFHLTVFFHVLFLVFFGYILVFNLYEQTSLFEWILLGWVLALLVEEMRQIRESRPVEILMKLRHYISFPGNWFDMLSFILYFIGFGLRFANLDVDAARVLLSFSYIVFCLRILSMFTVSKQLGPKLLMVSRMLKDLRFFLFILMVFLIAYGVASQSLLYPNESNFATALAGILSKPYWLIYGELFLSEVDYNPSTEEFSCTDNATLIAAGYRRCPQQNVIVPILTSVYLLLVNVLLLNLLIAMFSYSFDNLINKTDIIWKFQRYSLIKEYYDRPSLVVPFSFLPFIASVFGCRSIPEETAFVKKYEGEELRHLVSWEALNTEVYITELRKKEKMTVSSKVDVLSERVDSLMQMVESVSESLRVQKKMGKRLKRVEKKTQGSLEWIISALKDGKITPKKPIKPVHQKARTSPYPKSETTRLQLDDHFVPWDSEVLDYNPPTYTDSSVDPQTPGVPLPSWADPPVDKSDSPAIHYNEMDKSNNVNRISYLGRYEVVGGLPRNPEGRTGLEGRGSLGRYGPNHAIDLIVTRVERDGDGNDLEIDGKCVLQFIAIQRSDTSDWGLVGAMSNPNGSIMDIFEKKVQLLPSDGDELSPDSYREIKEFFNSEKNRTTIFKGYCDDYRNTDNAWIESVAYNYHDERNDLFADVTLQSKEGSGAVKVEWKRVEHGLEIRFADHQKYIEKVASLRKAYF